MSTGAVFTIINNTGGQDRMLYANDYLKKRIDTFIKDKNPQITEQELLNWPSDPNFAIQESILPGINFVEKTHLVYVSGTYKPSVMVASDYSKVTYNNPQFGQTIKYKIPQYGNFISDMYVYLKIGGLRAIDPRDRVRYVAFLGHKLFQNVQFLADDGFMIDEYGTDEYNAYYQFELQQNSIPGYLRCIGQSVPTAGTLTADPLNDMFSEQKYINNGLQTLKYAHDTVELFVPLLFWFKDPK